MYLVLTEYDTTEMTIKITTAKLNRFLHHTMHCQYIMHQLVNTGVWSL